MKLGTPLRVSIWGRLVQRKPQIFQKLLFYINDHKIQNFQNFQNTGIYVVELAVFNQCAKLQLDTIIFDPQKVCFSP